jgi:DNA-binding IclR family transcriptional regulator
MDRPSGRSKRPLDRATEKVPGTAAFSKFVSVLQTIADAPGELGMAVLCTRSGLPRATVYRIVAALRAEGFVGSDERLALGPRLISLASQSWAKFDLRTLAGPDLRGLRDDTGETVHLAVPSTTEMVYIDKLESAQTVRMTSRIGTRVRLHASSVGKAYLAALPASERDALLDQITLIRMTDRTITRRKDLEAELRLTRERGYAIDGEETEPEIHCLGAVVRNRAGRPVGGISISVPKYRFDDDAEARYPQLVVDCAERISAKLALSEGPSAD